MRIKTSYDCEFEQKDLANLASGHPLAATLSDGTIAFRFRMDPSLVNGPRRVKSVVTDAPREQKLLTEGTPPRKSHTTGGTCVYCKQGPYTNVTGHIRNMHRGQPLHPTGKFRCSQCAQRFSTNQGLSLHLRFSHKAKPKDAKKDAKQKLAPAEKPKES